MPAAGIALLWFGYWLTYYGLTQIQHGNFGFLDVGIPGRYTPQVALTPRDGPANESGNGKQRAAKERLAGGGF